MTNDTLVIFVSDNGAVVNDGYGDSRGLSRGKGSTFEGGIRLPGLARWPGQIPAGTQSDQVIADVDWFPTLARVAETATDSKVVLDGIDQFAALQDATVNQSRSLLVAAQNTSSYYNGLTKVVLNRNGSYNVFDLATDLGESNELSTAQPDLAAALSTSLDRELARMRADFSSTGNVNLINISGRARAGGVAGTPVPGFVITGTGNKPTVIRAVDPGLTEFGVSGVLANPQISPISNSTEIAANTQWHDADAIAFTTVGAFPLTSGSADAAVVTSLSAGSYTAPVDPGSASGVALLEVYDADIDDQSTQLVNTSTRAYVGTGDDILAPGFVVYGEGQTRLLIRAVGPGLNDFGVPDTLVNPRITLFRNGEAIASNDDWESVGTDITDASSAGGAFALSIGSLDTAILVPCPPKPRRR